MQSVSVFIVDLIAGYITDFLYNGKPKANVFGTLNVFFEPLEQFDRGGF